MVDQSMQMLPQHSKQFAEKEYWSEFFVESAKRSNEPSFEWYADFKDLKPFLQLLIPAASTVIVPGCGDSLLSEHTSLMGHKVVSFDFEPGVINKMQQRKSLVSYQVGDMLNMAYADNSFDVVLDKGSYDALCVDTESETQKKVSMYCEGIKRVLTQKGSYLLVSLLQDFVLDSLLTNFSSNAEITIYMIHQAASAGGSHFQRYLVHIQKSFELTYKIVPDLAGGEIVVLKSTEEVKNVIKIDQLNNMVGPMQVQMKEFKRGQSYTIQTDDQIQGHPRYTLHVVDSDEPADLQLRTMGCFVVPLGMEREMRIETYDAQIKIRRQAGFTRLVIVVLGRGHKYESLQQIQDQLSPKIMDICPSDCSNRTQIPYLSTNTHLHIREVVYSDPSILIEDYIDSDVGAQEHVVLRQVFFPANPTVVQSEVPIIYRNTKTSKQVVTENMKVESVLCPAKKHREVIFDRSRLTFEVYHAMLAALSFTNYGGSKLNILVCGTGAGVFTMFLKHQLGSFVNKLVTVDTDKRFVELGSQFFGFEEEGLESVIGDAHEYITQTKQQFDLIFMDVCYSAANDDGISPPLHFLNESFIESLQAALSFDGVCAINTMVRSDDTKKGIFKGIAGVTGTAKYRSKCTEDLNEVVYLVKSQEAPEQSGKSRLVTLQKNVTAMGLQQGVWLSRKGMKIVHHAEQMVAL